MNINNWSVKIEEEYSNLEINKLQQLGINVDPFDYDFVFSHIPVGKLQKIT